MMLNTQRGTSRSRRYESELIENDSRARTSRMNENLRVNSCALTLNVVQEANTSYRSLSFFETIPGSVNGVVRHRTLQNIRLS